MPLPNAIEIYLPDVEAAQTPLPPPPRLLKRLIDLRAEECRYCVADTPAGAMERALFCAAPVTARPYCADHWQVCRLPGRVDVEAMAAEIDAALDPNSER